jgi:SAM-dependent methyltransferase
VFFCDALFASLFVCRKPVEPIFFRFAKQCLADFRAMLMKRDSFEEMLNTQNRHWWFRGRRKILETLIKKCANLPENSHILEIGCGTGANLEMLSRFGSVKALELDEYAREHIPPVAGVEIFEGYLPDGLSSVRGETFDLICLFDVLEHIEQDVESLAAVKDFLKPGGKLLLTVPAYQWMFSVHDAVMGHYRRYSRHQMSLRCIRAGYEIVRSGYMNMCIFPLMLAVRIMDKIRGASKAFGTAIPPSGINAVLYSLFAAESLWIPYMRTPWGSSVLVLAEKENANENFKCLK